MSYNDLILYTAYFCLGAPCRCLALPFTFPFYGVDKSTIRVYSNGFATFSSTVGNSYTNPTGFPVANGPTNIDDVVAPFWDDLDQSLAGAVYTGALGDGRFPWRRYARAIPTASSPRNGGHGTCP